MGRYLTLIFLFSFLISKAQFFKEQANPTNFYFRYINLSFIYEHKVKSISTEYSYKEDNQRIINYGISEKIIFSAEGFPERKIRISNSDTVETFYYFLRKNISILREFSSVGITTIYFSYDSLGNKTKEVHCKEKNASSSKQYFYLLKQQIEWSETYTYQNLSKKQIRKKTFNDSGAEYKDAILYLDDNMNYTEESERFSVTGVSQNWKYMYDASGNIIEKNFFTDVVGVLEEKSTFTYDNRRNITGEKFYRNGILKQEKIYFYDVKNEFPQAVLTKYPDRKTIDLQNILIEFF